MAKALEKEDAAAFRRRWEALAEREREELRSMSFDEKFRQAAALMASVDALGWREALEVEDAQVRERWMRLRKVLCDRQ